MDKTDAYINAIIDRKRIPEEAPDIFHDMQRHYELVCKAAGSNGDMLADVVRVAGGDIDADDVVGSVKDALSECDRQSWARGFVNALAYHCDSITDLEEAMGAAGFTTRADAIKAGAEKQDADRIFIKCGRRWPVREPRSRKEK